MVPQLGAGPPWAGQRGEEEEGGEGGEGTGKSCIIKIEEEIDVRLSKIYIFHAK